MNIKFVGSIALLLLAGCSTGAGVRGSAGADDDWLADAMGPHRTVPQATLSGDLGGQTNPVRVLMPEGEREYLHRLRCPDGQPPTFERQGSFGIGPYDKILDGYTVECAASGEKITVFMDMYHCIEETRPIPGFEIAEEIGRRDRSMCE